MPRSLPLTLPRPSRVRRLTRSARLPALLLLLAAVAGLLVANSPAAPVTLAVRDAPLGAFGLSAGHVVSDGLLALFFFIAAVELRHEIAHGALSSRTALAAPAIAAAGGVLVPIGVYALVSMGSARDLVGWPVPTATDIAFALGVLAVFGRGLPTRIRVFLLALAVLDDVVGIVLIAVLFTAEVNAAWLAAATLAVVLFALLGRGRTGGVFGNLVSWALALTTWWAVHESGVHATIAGVLLGLVLSPGRAARARRALEPAVMLGVLPLFAFVSALVEIPAVSPSQFAPAFWGIVLALPFGKIAGIVLGGVLARRIARSDPASVPPLGDLLAVGSLGGVGFTVSLLLADLAFAGDALRRDEAVLGVLCGSCIALVLSAMLVSWRAWHHRVLLRTTPPPR